MTALALLISASIAAQNVNQNQEQKQTQAREQVQDGSGIQTRSQTGEEKKMLKARKKVQKANHGQTVSETAKSLESGPGKGQVVSTQARNKGEIPQVNEKNSAKNQNANKGARGNPAQQNKIKTSAGAGPGRK